MLYLISSAASTTKITPSILRNFKNPYIHFPVVTFPEVSVCIHAGHVKYGKVEVIFCELFDVVAYGRGDLHLGLPFEMVYNCRFPRIVQSNNYHCHFFLRI